MVDTANFTTLTIVDTFTLKKQRSLVKSTRTSVKLNTQTWDTPTMKNICGRYPNTDWPFSRKEKVVVDGQQAKSSLTFTGGKLLSTKPVAIKRSSTSGLKSWDVKSC